ncbi:MAG: sulfatase [Abitibacteriaceae bacterium]|nr:sulfatase [Abditibacteriaceae bacterium]
MKRPNILYIHSHDTGRYVQPYGHAIATPNIQRLAEAGVLFRQAFCASPTCSPSRAALLTGQCAHSSGMLGLAHRGFGLHDYSQHLVHTLRGAGYYSALAGMQHVAEDPATIGYDAIIGTPAAAEVVAQEFLSHAPEQPFFLDVGFEEVHRLRGTHFTAPGPSGDARYCLPPPSLPDTPAVRQDMADFKVAAQTLDHKIGVVLDALEANGLAENTFVICTTDHGLAFPGMKCNLTDRGIGVMLIMRGPGGFNDGAVSDALISHIDVFPTLCDLLQIKPPPWLQGRSLLPLVRGEATEINEAIFAEVTYHAAYEPQRAVRTSRWKYIRRFSEDTHPVLPNCDDSLSKRVWLEHGWPRHYLASEQLYDLIFDPQEMHNLAGDAAWTEVLQEMRDRLAHWMEATDDPLRHGPVPPPGGAQVNDPHGVSPNEPTHVVA